MNRFTNQVKVQQLFPLSSRLPHSNTKQIGLFWRKSPKRSGNKVPGCTRRSDLPYCKEPVGSQTSIPCSNCQARGQPGPLCGVLKGRSSRRVVPAAARALPGRSPKAGWEPRAARLGLAAPKLVTKSKLALLATQKANRLSNFIQGASRPRW